MIAIIINYSTYYYKYHEAEWNTFQPPKSLQMLFTEYL